MSESQPNTSESLPNTILVVEERIHEDGEPKNEPKPTQFYIISICYLIYTITDSALRMIILFELFTRKFDIIAIGVMFSWYEAIGIITNLVGGILGSKHGLRLSLLIGLSNQLLGIGLLSILVVSENWDKYSVIVFVTENYSIRAQNIII